MSASLVGSEMCIRDRCQTTTKRSEMPWTTSGLSGLSAVSSRALPGIRPVSYTHLTLPTICSV
eukprot:12165232-Alexandrium_andersonii.AAC.1